MPTEWTELTGGGSWRRMTPGGRTLAVSGRNSSGYWWSSRTPPDRGFIYGGEEPTRQLAMAVVDRWVRSLGDE